MGQYHFQTKINAKDFTNIKVKSQLLCNDSSIQQMFAEYNSIDKNNTSIDLTTSKLTFDGETQASAILTEEQAAELSIDNVMQAPHRRT